MTETFEQMALRVAANAIGYEGGLQEINEADIHVLAKAIRDELSKFAKPVAYMTTSDDGDPAMLFFDAGEALKYSGEDSPMNLFAFPPSAAARIAELEKQRDGLLAAVEKFIDSHEECTDFDGFPAQIASMDDYHEFQGAIAKAKEVAS